MRSIKRYNRQVRLFGKTGQKRLFEATVAVIGAGGIGSNTAEGLTRLGIGTIKFFDPDTISEDNLNRQVLYKEKDIGKYKVDSLKKELHKINSEVKIKSHKTRINLKNARELLSDCNLILDCTDRLEQKIKLNKIAYLLKIPLIYASAIRRDVRLYFIDPNNQQRACLSCFLQKTEQRTKAITNSTAHIASNLQINETIKFLTEKKYEKSFIIFNLNTLSMLKLKANKKKNCPICNLESFK